MTSPAAPSFSCPRTARPGFRASLRLTLATALAVGGVHAAQAQAAPDSTARFEFMVSSGALVPTGAQRTSVAAGQLTNAQLSYLVRPNVALTTSLGWTRSRDIVLAGEPTLDLFTYDVGGEVRGPVWSDGNRWSFMPFAGAGAGGRSYSYRSLARASTHNLAGYVSVGGEVGYSRVRLRLEARNYMTGFKALGGAGASGTRNDVALLVGLRITAPSK